MIHRRSFTAGLSLAMLAALGPQARGLDVAARPKAVVELFTSQGCAQCPPADALLTSLADKGDVVALAYHVDYWDYAGWKDTFGATDFSDRQRDYAKSWGSSRIYTPQMVINGSRGVVGSKRHDVHAAIDRASLPLGVTLEGRDGMLEIDIPADATLEDAVVWMVTYLDRAEVTVESGENAGKSMVYTQVVTDRQILGMWEARSGARLKLPLPEILSEPGTGIAVLVQQEHSGMPGAILGAAAYRP